METELKVLDLNNLTEHDKLAIKNGRKLVKRANKQIKFYHLKNK